MAEHIGILIGGEVVDGNVTTVTRELFTTGRKIGDGLGLEVGVLLTGEDIQKAAESAAELGAHKVYTAQVDASLESHPEFIAALMAAAVRELKPGVVIMGQTDMGRDVAPRLAATLRASVTLDCIDLAVDPDSKSLLVSRPVFGGKAVAVWVSERAETQIVTMRPRAAQAAEPEASRQCEIVPISVSVDASTIKGEFVEAVKEEVKGIKLEEADVIITGGGGIGGTEGFKLLGDLAELLGGAVGSTRVPCDEGWVPKTMEIGQTSRIVGPALYFAVGVSGAPQHMAGCSESKCIVAINKDPEAPIFKAADFGVVGDYREALPALFDKLKELKR